MSKAEQEHKSKLVDLGCMYCRVVLGIHGTPAQLHHVRGGGWGKGSYKTLIPMCHEHHLGKTVVHGMGTKAFDRESGTTQAELLRHTLELVNA